MVKEKNHTEKKAVATAYGVSTRYFNEKNKLQYTLLSKKVIEYSNNYGAELVEPDVTVFDNAMITIWQGNADRGIVSSDKDHLLLQNNVRIVEMPLGNKPTYITGEAMTYQAKKSLLTSDVPVKIDDGIIMQVSDKLTLDTKTKELNATDKVRATYNTNKNIPQKD